MALMPAANVLINLPSVKPGQANDPGNQNHRARVHDEIKLHLKVVHPPSTSSVHFHCIKSLVIAAIAAKQTEKRGGKKNRNRNDAEKETKTVDWRRGKPKRGCTEKMTLIMVMVMM